MTVPKKIGIIGNGKIAKECAMLVRACAPEACALTHVVIDGSRSNISTDLQTYCTAEGVGYALSSKINAEETLNYLGKNTPDIILSINNHQIIRDELLALPPEGIINFHNGPLPRYGGLNACSWAIYNDEKQHGVTWHEVAGSVDSGDIVAQKIFDVPAESTALRLVMMCIQEGISLFKAILPALLAGTYPRVLQDQSQRLYYLSSDVPGYGVLDFTQSAAQLDRLVRAMNYSPLSSPVGHPAARLANKAFFVDKLRIERQVTEATPGEILRVDDALYVQTGGGVVALIEMRDARGVRLSFKDFMAVYQPAAGMKIDKGEEYAN